MALIVTLPESERRAPLPFRRRGESYWVMAELPLDNEWVFVVNTIADHQRSLPLRSIVTVTAPQLLDVLARLEPESISSVYLLRRVIEDGADTLSINRVSAVRSGEDQENGCARVLIFDTEDGEAFVSQEHLPIAGQLVNEVEVVRFRHGPQSASAHSRAMSESLTARPVASSRN